ncbi:MAG: two-component sensor histidine kinase [Zoogloeaceae bacterium]|uniref:ATP-binding protein n=1 Tax=Denitromonas sp. TaxID=2734609 RepID=UPI001D65B01F|nr:two-component sensor histidine kinase [Rhodocyclaceae bacterium]MCP5222318.1 two-component sensor histidine kinase [Zoogloeaceae bacterium]
MTSLRRRLLVSLLGAIVTVFLVAGVAIYQMAHNEVDEVMDYQLRQLALSLSDQRFGQAAPIAPPEEAFDFVIQIWDGHGLRLYLSHPHSVLPDLAQFGYTTVKAGEDDWRIYSIPLRDRVIQVAQPMRVRRAMAAKAALRTLVPLLVLVPLLGAIIWYLIGRGLRPLDTLARGVTARRADALSPLSDSGVPDEALPLVRALNGLLDRLSQALAAQRAFVADAAHALRTPLTALQLQLQLTERADTAAERQAALSELRGGLTRAIRLVEQLLTLARQSPDNDAPAPRTRVDLSALARNALTALAPLAEAQHIDLGATELANDAAIVADPATLRTALDNLIDNAIRYTPAGGRVDLAVRRADGRLWLEVSDTGPGIAPAERARVLDRFYRQGGEPTDGSGLGLAIVKAIAEHHGAALVLDAADGGGLRAGLGFAPAEATAQTI